MNKILSKIQKELKENIDNDYRERSFGFFKEPVKIIGVRSKIVDQIAKKYFSEIKDFEKKEIYNLCEELLKSGYNENQSLSFNWLFKAKKQYTKSDFKIFEGWLKNYISNWGSCDNFCTHAFGHFLLGFPEFLSKAKEWTKSKNRWFRRASAVIMIYPNRKDRYIENSFEIADILLKDKDDLVQKGYGWMLKEISNLYPEKVFDYIMENKAKMPRTALRYAVEKLSEDLKKKAMKK